MLEGTPRQQRAQQIESQIKQELTVQELSWQEVAALLAEAHDQKLYEELDFDKFPAWAESIGIGSSKAYDLVVIYNSPHRDMLFSVGIAKARLILPKLVNTTPEKAADLINDVSELTWHDARQRLYGDDPQARIYVVSCPSCGKSLRASKSVTLELGH